MTLLTIDLDLVWSALYAWGLLHIKKWWLIFPQNLQGGVILHFCSGLWAKRRRQQRVTFFNLLTRRRRVSRSSLRKKLQSSGRAWRPVEQLKGQMIIPLSLFCLKFPLPRPRRVFPRKNFLFLNPLLSSWWNFRRWFPLWNFPFPSSLFCFSSFDGYCFVHLILLIPFCFPLNLWGNLLPLSGFSGEDFLGFFAAFTSSSVFISFDMMFCWRSNFNTRNWMTLRRSCLSDWPSIVDLIFERASFVESLAWPMFPWSPIKRVFVLANDLVVEGSSISPLRNCDCWWEVKLKNCDFSFMYKSRSLVLKQTASMWMTCLLSIKDCILTKTMSSKIERISEMFFFRL